MGSFVTSLTEGAAGLDSLGIVDLWDNISGIAPLVVILVLFSLARRVINKNLSAAGKGKSGRI